MGFGGFASSGTGVVVPTRGSCDFWANHLDCCEKHVALRTCAFRHACDKMAVGLRKRREGATMPATREEVPKILRPGLFNQKRMDGVA